MACTRRNPAVLYIDRKHDGKRRWLGETKDGDALGAGAVKIRQYIIENEMKAGDRLPNELQMAEYCEVGRGTVRDAIKLLRFEGWWRWFKAAAPIF